MKQIQKWQTTLAGYRHSIIAHACRVFITLLSSTQMVSANAGDFSLDNGIEGQWLLGKRCRNASLGSFLLEGYCVLRTCLIKPSRTGIIGQKLAPGSV